MRRSLTLTALLGLLATLLVAPTASAAPSAPAAPAIPPAEVTPYAGGGSANLLEVHSSIPVGDADIADVILSPVATDVDTSATPRSSAEGANLDASLLGAIDLSEVLVDVSQTAPPDNADPVEDTLIPVPIAPVVEAGVSTARAHARWPGDGVCLAPGAPISTGYNETAGATVLEIPDVGSVATVDDEADTGVTGTQSQVTTAEVPGEQGRALVSTSETRVDQVTLFAGTPLELSIGVAASPTLTAVATGQPGGATVTYNDPLVTIEAPEDGVFEGLEPVGGVLDETVNGVLADLLPGLLGALDPLLEGVVNIELAVGEQTLETATNPDGTGAAGTVSLVRLSIEVLPVLGDPLLDVSVDIAPMEAFAAVPVGGINCNPDVENPLRDVHKDVSAADVAPGGQFDYTLTIPNRGPCTLTDVVVTDTIEGPVGEVTAEPTWTAREGNTFRWDVGTLEPEETYTITMTIQVPADAQPGTVFVDNLAATGVCDGEPVGKEVELPLPTVNDNFVGPCDLILSNKSASHLEVIPGQTFNYFVHVFNRGAEPCTDVTVTDTLDDRLTFVSCTDDCTNSGQQVVWSGETVPGGSSTTYTVTVLVNDGATGTLRNVAIIDSPDDAGDPVTVTHEGPEITTQSILAPPNPPALDPASLPTTGLELPRWLLAGLGLAAVAGLGIRRRLATS